MSQRTARSHQTAAFEHSPQYAGSVRTLRSAKEPAKQAAKEPIKHAAKRSAHGADPHDYAKSARGDRGKQSSIGAILGRLEASLDRVEYRQALALNQMQDRYENKARQIRGALAQLGLKPDAAGPASGGPFVPVKVAANDQAFGRALLRVNVARADASALSNTLLKVPLRKPMTGDIDESSPFGVRTDPFVHEAAMHTGIDFRGDTGAPNRP